MFNDEYTSIFPRPTEFSGISLFDINSTGNNEWERRGYPLLNTHYNVHYNIFPLFLQSLYVIRSKVPISKTTYQRSLNLFHFFYEGREGRVWSCNGNMQFFFYENYSRMKQRFYAAEWHNWRSRRKTNPMTYRSLLSHFFKSRWWVRKKCFLTLSATI